MRQASWSNIVAPHMSRSRKGAGRRRSRISAASARPGREERRRPGADFSTTGITGSPVRRSSTKISPCFVGCTSAARSRRRSAGRRGSAAPARRSPKGRGARSGSASAAGRCECRARRSRTSTPRLRRAVGAPLIRRLVAERHVDETEALVGAHDRPGVRAVRRVGLPSAIGWVSFGLPESPVPQEIARRDVEGADDAGRLGRRTLSSTVPPTITLLPATITGEVE